MDEEFGPVISDADIEQVRQYHAQLARQHGSDGYIEEMLRLQELEERDREYEAEQRAEAEQAAYEEAHAARHSYTCYSQPDGTVLVFNWTNDNYDTGYPSAQASWDSTERSLEAAKRHIGTSRRGFTGCLVRVTLDGRVINQLEDWDL